MKATVNPSVTVRGAFVAAALLTGFAGAQTIEVDPANAIPATHTQVQAWEFSTDGNAEGWTGTNYGPLTVAGGILSGSTSATSGDTQLSNTFTAIPLGYATIVEFSVTVDPGTAAVGAGNVFWADYGGGIAGTRTRGFSVPEDAAPHMVRMTFPGGVKNLASLRLDPTSVAVADLATQKTVSFDYVRVYHYQPTSFTNVKLTASDAAGTTSMNSAGGWDSGAAPSVESNYFTGAFQLRTQDGTLYLPFGGSTLSADPGGSLLLKGSGGTLVRQMTLAGGSLIQGATGATPDTAKLFVPDGISVTAATALDLTAANRNLELSGSLSGSPAINVKCATAPGAGQGGGQVVLKSDNTSYTGTLTVETNAWLDLDHDNAVAGANVVVQAGAMVRRIDADANGTTAAASWALSGVGTPAGNDATRGVLYFSYNGLNATLAGDIAISGASTRIGTYSAGGVLAIDGAITGSGTLQLWGGGGAEGHVQTFTLNGASTINGQTDLLAEFGAQTHLVLGGDNRLPTTKKLRMSAAWGPVTAEGAGAFLDLKGFDQTLSNLQLDGAKRKTIRDTTASGNSTLTLTASTNGFDTNGGNVYIEGITINQTGAAADAGAQIDGGGITTLTNSTWNAPFYTSLGNAGNGTLVLKNSTFNFGGELLMARSGSTGTLSVDATSTVSTPNFFRIGDSPAGIATVNLNGGTLAARRFNNGNTGTSILNLDGGILKATGNNPTDWISGGANPVVVNLKSNGITINSNGFKVTATAAILEDAGSTGGGLAKEGAGTLYLDGTNTYTGFTPVTAGFLGGNGSVTSNVTVSGTGGLAFLVTNPALGAGLGYSDLNVTGTLTVPASMVIKIDSASAVFPEVNATGLTLVTASAGISGFGTVTFDLTSFTGTGTWAASQVGNSIILNYTAGSGASPYDHWATTNGYWTPGAPNTLPGDDFDKDGASNLAEFAFGGNPTSGTSVGPRHFEITGGKFVLTVAVRSGAAAVFPGIGSPLTAALDGVNYTVGGSKTLVGFAENVNKLGTVILGPLTTPPAGYEFVSFELDDTVSGNAKGFLRATATATP